MKKVILVLATVMLSACATKTVTVTEYITKYELVKPDQSLLENCRISETIKDKEKYALSTYSVKEKVLYQFSNSLLGDIAICNTQWEELRKWYVGQEAIYKNVK